MLKVHYLNVMEYILCAAYKRLVSKIPEKSKLNYKHPSKWESHGKIDDIYEIEIGRRHNDILTRFPNELNQHKDGFYTSHGRFVDRYEALQLALAANQVNKDNLSGTPYTQRLFSEDLY